MATLEVEKYATGFYTAPGTAEGVTLGRNPTSKIGFYGAAPVARPRLSATPEAADIARALAALGLVTLTE